MALDVKRVDVWVAGLKDRPGALAEKVRGLAKAGVLLDFMVARRSPDKPGTGVVFLAPVKGAAQMKAAKELGFRTTKTAHSVRIAGPDKAGIAARMISALAEAGINLRGLSGAAVGKRFVAYLALDTAADAAKAVRILKKVT